MGSRLSGISRTSYLRDACFRRALKVLLNKRRLLRMTSDMVANGFAKLPMLLGKLPVLLGKLVVPFGHYDEKRVRSFQVGTGFDEMTSDFEDLPFGALALSIQFLFKLGTPVLKLGTPRREIGLVLRLLIEDELNCLFDIHYHAFLTAVIRSSSGVRLSRTIEIQEAALQIKAPQTVLNPVIFIVRE